MVLVLVLAVPVVVVDAVLEAAVLVQMSTRPSSTKR
jgi:hypothetical protein